MCRRHRWQVAPISDITDRWHFHPWEKVSWPVLSGVGFCCSCWTREAPYLQIPCLSQSLSILTSHHLFLADHSSPSQLCNWPTFPMSPGRAWCQTTAWDLLSPLPFLLAAQPALASRHLATLSPSRAIDARISSHIALSSFPEGPHSASHSILFCQSSVRRHGSSFFHTSLLCLSCSPFPWLFLPDNFSSFFCPFTLPSTLLTIISL